MSRQSLKPCKAGAAYTVKRFRGVHADSLGFGASYGEDFACVVESSNDRSSHVVQYSLSLALDRVIGSGDGEHHTQHEAHFALWHAQIPYPDCSVIAGGNESIVRWVHMQRSDPIVSIPSC